MFLSAFLLRGVRLLTGRHAGEVVGVERERERGKWRAEAPTALRVDAGSQRTPVSSLSTHKLGDG